MTLALSTTLTHIDIDDSDIIEIHRSAQPAIPPDPRYDGHPCEAYLCTGRKDTLLLAYVAILDTVTRRPSIFTSSCDAKDTAACEHLLTEAREFVAAQGFSLQKINIDYGVAMRQVIIRNLRIMRPAERPRAASIPPKPAPEKPNQTKAAAAPAKTPPPPKAPAPSKPAPAESCQAENPQRAAELSALQTAFEGLSREKSEAEAIAGRTIADLTAQLEQAGAACATAEQAVAQYRQTADDRLRELDRLGAELTTTAEARLAAKETLDRETARHRESETLTKDEIKRLEAALEEERTRNAASEARAKETEASLHKAESDLKSETRQRIEAEATAKKRERAVRKELAELREEVSATTARLQDAEEQNRALLTECDHLRAQLNEALASPQPAQEPPDAALALEIERLNAANDALSARLDDTRTGHDRTRGELERALGATNETAARLQDAEEQNRALLMECDHLHARLNEALVSSPPTQEPPDAALALEIERLNTANKVLSDRLEEIQTEHDRTRGELERELGIANEAAASLAADLERLSDEKRSWEYMRATLKKKVQHAVERLKKEKEALQEELHRLRVERDERPLPAPPAAPEPAISPSLVMASADAESPRSGTGHTMGTSLGRPGSAFQSGESTFRHDPKLSAVPCHAPGEVIEVHGSINAIQAGPFGTKPQVCLAYVLGVRHGRKTAVYLAWLLKEERSVLICKPEKQPENADGYAGTMGDAIFYFESTGFMMDQFDLSKGMKRQLSALEESGICRFAAQETPRASTA